MKMALLFMLLMTASCLHAQEKPTRWEHGWKTHRVIATRFKSDFLGQNIRFEFPQIPYDCDDAKLFRFIESHGGAVFEGGGYPGAPLYAIFKGVTDAASADRKLQEILPALDQLAKSLER